MAAHMNARALPWLEKVPDEPFFLFLHCWDPHTPYLPPEDLKYLYYKGNENDPHNESLKECKAQSVYPFYEDFHYKKLGKVTDADYITALYDAQVTAADREIARLFDTLKRTGLDKNTVVFITADHGENMTEHGFYWCHQGTYEEVIAVPLIVWSPSMFSEGKIVDALVQHADILPTIAELAGFDPPKQQDGVSLMPLMCGEKKDGHEFVILSECIWQARCGIRTSQYKFMKNVDPGVFKLPQRELYDLHNDPKELKNLYKEHPELAKELEFTMDRWIEEHIGNRPNPLRLEAEAGLDGPDLLSEALKKREANWNTLTPGEAKNT